MTLDSAPLPYLTAEISGVGGKLKVEPEDFVVEEIPSYEPCGTGEHLFLWIEKRDLPHDQLLRRVARGLDIPSGDIGTAGIKDRRAVTRQYVSVPARGEAAVAALESPQLRVLKAVRHGNKLRTGHLRGNRFTIDLRAVSPQAIERAELIVDRLQPTGFPNYYGEQRFGIDGQTLSLGLDLLAGRKTPRDIPYEKRKFLLRLSLSSVQSHLFNQALAERLRDRLLTTVLDGDVMEVCESGGKFVMEDLTREQQRLDQGEIAVTGPMFGTRMLAPRNVAAARESALLERSGLSLPDFANFAQLLPGARRSFLIRPEGLTVEQHEPGSLRVQFSLPSGAYATMLLRELMKVDSDEITADAPEPDGE